MKLFKMFRNLSQNLAKSQKCDFMTVKNIISIFHIEKNNE